MKKASRTSLALDILAIPNVQKSLQRLAELLAKVQKALGEYLDSERARFPRFYFVGDEDLLDMIGNGKDVVNLQKHLKKMFAGIHHVLLQDNGDIKDKETVVGTTPHCFASSTRSVHERTSVRSLNAQ